MKYGRADYKWRTDAKLTAAQVRAAHRVHIEAGVSIRELGRLMWERFGYASPQSCSNCLSDLFKRAGLKARDRVDATVKASTKHGRGARNNKAAYKRWHRATSGRGPRIGGRNARIPCELGANQVRSRLASGRGNVTIYSIAELIQKFGSRVQGRRCCTCGHEALFEVGRYEHAPFSFLACLICDVTAEERKAHGFSV